MICEINGQEAEKLFLPNWQYNVVRIQNELKRIVEAAGGKCVTTDHYKDAVNSLRQRPIYVVNRSIMGAIKEIENYIARLDPDNISPRHMDIYWGYERKLEHLKSIPNEPILKTGARDFVLDGILYSILFDQNMFMDTYYLVADVEQGTPSTVRYSYYKPLEDEKWKYDFLMTTDCTDKDIHEVAMKLLKILREYKPNQRGDKYLYIHC